MTTTQEVDRRRIGEIARGAAYLSDPKTGLDALHQNLVIEDEIIAVVLVRNAAKHFSPKSTIAAVVLLQVKTKSTVLDCGQEAICAILVQGHPAL